MSSKQSLTITQALEDKHCKVVFWDTSTDVIVLTESPHSFKGTARHLSLGSVWDLVGSQCPRCDGEWKHSSDGLRHCATRGCYTTKQSTGQLVLGGKPFKYQDSRANKWDVPSHTCVDCNHSYPAFAEEYKFNAELGDMAKCNGEPITECPYCIDAGETAKVVAEIAKWDAEQNKPLTEEEIVFSEFEEGLHEAILADINDSRANENVNIPPTESDIMSEPREEKREFAVLDLSQFTNHIPATIGETNRRK